GYGGRRSGAGTPRKDHGSNLSSRTFQGHARAPGVPQAGEERTPLTMTAIAVGLRLALIVIPLGCLWLFIAHPWWFPAGTSSQAEAVDRGFKTAWWLLGVLFVSGQLLLALLLQRPRSSPVPGRNWRGSLGLEIGWIAVIAGIFFWFHLS